MHSNERESSDILLNGSETDDREFARDKVEFPEKNLFVWALLYDRLDIAKIFWKTGEFQTMTALFASNILKKMATRLSDLESHLNEEGKYFEDTACSVLTYFDKNNDDLKNGDILLQKVPYYEDLNCLDLAIQGNCLKFISLSCVQTLITSVWNGEIASKSGLLGTINVKSLFFLTFNQLVLIDYYFKYVLSIGTFGILAPFLMFEKRDSIINIVREANYYNRTCLNRL